jgi:hypothetical protein
MNEIEVINKMQTMCEESCSPEQFEAWEDLKNNLMKTRKSLRCQPQHTLDAYGCSCGSKDDHHTVACYLGQDE